MISGLLMALLAVLLASSASAAPRVLVLYDGKPDNTGEGYLSARYISNLLGHFDTAHEMRHVARYGPGDFQTHDVVFFACTNPAEKLPPRFFEDAVSAAATVVWLGRQAGQLLSNGRAEKLGFSYIDYTDDDDFDKVIYRNVQLKKNDPELSLVAVLDGQRVRVHATAQNSSGLLYPYALQSGRFWYFADSPFYFYQEGDRYLVFADLLHDILGQPHADAPARRAMVRIEDVTLDQDPGELRAIADYLYSQRVPFQIALVPIFRDPDRGLNVHLSDRYEFAEAIRYMVSRGGTVVLHGVTHQYRGVSGDDYEFWNDVADAPVPQDSDPEALDRKLDLAFRECFRNGIYPVSWETPHNAGSANTYTFLKKYFTVFHERVMAAPRMGTEQFFPYTVRDLYGRFVVPENLGYLAADKTDPAPIVDHARAMLSVRDGISGFYFHPFMKLDYLKQMVTGIRELGYNFVSLREFAPEVRFRQWQVSVAGPGGEVALNAARPKSGYARRIVVTPGGEMHRSVVEAASATAERFAPGTLVAWEPAAGPEPPQPSLMARLRAWWNSGNQPVSETRVRDLPPVALLWNREALAAVKREQEGFDGFFRTFGYRVERITFRVGAALALPPGRLVVIPPALAPQLSPSQQTAILDQLRAGGRLLLAGRSPLAERLGLEFADRQIPVTQASDTAFPERFIRWEPPEQVERFEPPGEYVTIALDPTSRQPLAFSNTFGQGHYIYLATPLDPPAGETSGLGLARYPYLAQHVQAVFDTSPRLVRPPIEAYFDPGLRAGVDPSRLVNSWRKTGIRIVHVAAWQDTGQWKFNYRPFIDLCHRNGIAVYAWFEPPMVTKAFWDQHPEWREKTATGEDGLVGWRYLMNLWNPQARQAAFAVFREILALDWDGVNLAELNFDAAEPVMTAAKYVPMNADVRAQFQAERGFDPVELFRPASPHYWERNPDSAAAFTEFRVRMITELHRLFLEEVMRIRQGRDFEIVVTMLDSLHSRKLRQAIGVDSREIVRLMDRYPFTLQVEDPAEFWARSPERYRLFARSYLGLVKDASRLVFDVNVVDRDVRGTELPTALATGTEFARTLAAAAAATGRVAVYAEHTVPPPDWELAASVLAAGASIRPEGDGWRIESPFAVTVRVPRYRSAIYLNGKAWPAFEPGGVLVPRGSHRLEFTRPFLSLVDFDQLQLRLRSLTGELLAAGATPRGMTFEYSSAGRAVAVFNKQPYHVEVDGREWTASPLFSRGEWALSLPSGRHRVRVVATEPRVFVVEATSLLFSSFIVLFGTVSCAGMAGLYLIIRMRRAARSARRRLSGPLPGATT